MAQEPLFDQPADRLGQRLHDEVFGGLPRRLARTLDVPEVAAAVRPLLVRGWRPGQLATRVGALPEPRDPVSALVAFLEQLLSGPSPREAWEAERAERARADEAARGQPPASDEVRAHWVTQARQTLGMPARVRPVATPKPPPACSCCRGEGAFFVTREVRLCTACVDLLGSGRARLAVSA